MLEAILAKGPSQRLFKFLAGIGDEQIYDVSFRNATSEISSTSNSMLSIAQDLETWELESIGTYLSEFFM